MDNNPLNWMPRLGESKEIPGGILWCDNWIINFKRSSRLDYRLPNNDVEFVEGEITIKFRCTIEEYKKAVKICEKLENNDVKLLSNDV